MNELYENSKNGEEKIRILMPYFLAGSGHLVSSHAISHYISKKKPAWDIRLLEPADEFQSKELDDFFRRTWQVLLKNPKFAIFAFNLMTNLLPAIPIGVLASITKKVMPTVRDYLLGYKPHFIVTTHWGTGHLFQAARQEYGIDIPLYLVRNDLGGAYQIQNCEPDITFVMSEEARQAFIDIGFSPDVVVHVNPLVRPQFVHGATNENQARASLGIPQSAFTVLLSAGGEGLGSIRGVAKGFLDEIEHRGIEARLIVITGRNTELQAQLERELNDNRVLIQGYREDMYIPMAAADIVVGKCGANYTMETLMLRKPFVVTQVGAPNEEFNKDFVINHRFGWFAPTPNDFLSVLRRILDKPEELAGFKQRLAKMPTKNGAEQIADRVIGALTKSRIAVERIT